MGRLVDGGDQLDSGLRMAADRGELSDVLDP
jgi:hypothetical protein